MKFTEEEALEKIKANLTEKGKTLQMSQRTLKVFCHTYYTRFVDEEIELDAFITNYIDDFKEFDGNVNYEKSNFIKKTQEENPIIKKDVIPGGDNRIDPPDKLETLMKQIEEIKTENEKQRKERLIEQKRNDFFSGLNLGGVKVEDEENKWFKCIVSKVKLDESSNVEKEVQDYIDIYNQSEASRTNVPTPSPGARSVDDKEKFATYKAMREKKNEQERKI